MNPRRFLFVALVAAVLIPAAFTGKAAEGRKDATDSQATSLWMR